MSGFWAQRVGASQQQATAPATVAARNQPWWMPGVAPQSTSAPVHEQVVEAARWGQGTVQQPQQQATVAPQQEVSIGALLSQDGYTTEKAKSAQDNEPCPDCGSPNFIRPHTSKNAMKQCFNCGYNERFAHSTAGASGIGQKNVAPPKAARVQALTQNNYNPQSIIGRVG